VSKINSRQTQNQYLLITHTSTHWFMSNTKLEIFWRNVSSNIRITSMQ